MRVRACKLVDRLQYERTVAHGAREKADFTQHIREQLAREFGLGVMQLVKMPEFVNYEASSASRELIMSLELIVHTISDYKYALEVARKQGYAEGLAEGKAAMRNQVRIRWATMGERLLAGKVTG